MRHANDAGGDDAAVRDEVGAQLLQHGFGVAALPGKRPARPRVATPQIMNGRRVARGPTPGCGCRSLRVCRWRRRRLGVDRLAVLQPDGVCISVRCRTMAQTHDDRDVCFVDAVARLVRGEQITGEAEAVGHSFRRRDVDNDAVLPWKGGIQASSPCSVGVNGDADASWATAVRAPSVPAAATAPRPASIARRLFLCSAMSPPSGPRATFRASKVTGNVAARPEKRCARPPDRAVMRQWIFNAEQRPA